MTRQEAIDLFGSIPEMAVALGITRSAIYQWPHELDQERSDRALGAAVRLGRVVPPAVRAAPAPAPENTAA